MNGRTRTATLMFSDDMMTRLLGHCQQKIRHIQYWWFNCDFLYLTPFLSLSPNLLCSFFQPFSFPPAFPLSIYYSSLSPTLSSDSSPPPSSFYILAIFVLSFKLYLFSLLLFLFPSIIPRFLFCWLITLSYSSPLLSLSLSLCHPPLSLPLYLSSTASQLFNNQYDSTSILQYVNTNQ